MIARLRRARQALAIVACGIACGRETPVKAASDSAAAPATVATAPAASDSATPAPAARGCPRHGLWQPCNVEDRLAAAGMVFERRPDPVRHDFMSVAGIMYATRRTEIEVFLYPSAADRARDTDRLDAESVSPRDRRVIWKQPALLVLSNNLAAIVLGLNEREVERVSNALGAGLPPSPDR